jgi:hypothetical protein
VGDEAAVATTTGVAQVFVFLKVNPRILKGAGDG